MAIDLSQFTSYEEMVIATGQAAAKASIELDKLRQGVERAVTQSFKQLSIAIAGLVTAGLQGTQEAGRLSIAWMLLTRQIASVFLPIIDAFTQGMRQLSNYMAGLTGDGQRVAMIFGVLATIVPVMARVFSLLRGVLSPLYLILVPIVEGLYQFFTKTEEGKMIIQAIGKVMEWFSPILNVLKLAFLAIVDAIVVGFQAITRAGLYMAIKLVELAKLIYDIPIVGDLAGGKGGKVAMGWLANFLQLKLDRMNDEGWGIKGKPGEKGEKERRDVSPNNFRFEAIGAAMERITLAANKTGADPIKIAQEQLAAQQAALPLLGGIAEATRRQNPAIAR